MPPEQTGPPNDGAQPGSSGNSQDPSQWFVPGGRPMNDVTPPPSYIPTNPAAQPPPQVGFNAPPQPMSTPQPVQPIEPSQPQPAYVGGEVGTPQVFVADPSYNPGPVMPPGTPVVGTSTALPGAPGPVPETKKKSRLRRLLLPITIIVVLLGGMTGFVFGYYIPHQPRYILGTSLLNTLGGKDLTSASFSGNASIVDSSSKTTYAASLTGSADQSGKLDATLSVDAVVTNLTLEIRTVDGKNYYAKVGGLDGVNQLLSGLGISSSDPAVTSLISSVNNQWYEINQSLVTQLEKSANYSSPKALSPSDINKLSKIYRKDEFIKINKVLADQAIGGVQSYHYNCVINQTKLANFVSDLKAANITDLGVSQSALKDLVTGIGKANTAKYPFDIWIAKSNKIIDQLSLSNSTGGNPYTIKLTLNNINKPISVTAPSGAKSVLQLIGQVTQDFGGGTSGGSTDSTGGGSSTPNPLDLLDGGGSTPSTVQSL
jgi:hypothetical protein